MYIPEYSRLTAHILEKIKLGRVYGMYRTEINGQEVVIRFTHNHQCFNHDIEREAIKSILQLQSRIFQYKQQCFATSVESIGYIVSFVQDGEVTDVQIQNIIPFENVIKS